MSEGRATALQLCPFSEYLELGLQERFEVVRWYELDRDKQDSWLKQNADYVHAVVTGGHIGCSNELMAALPSLGIIAINGVGADLVDLRFAKSRGIHVTTTPGAPTEDTADLAVGMIIGLLRRIPAADGFVRSGEWTRGDMPLAHKVSGRRFGIVGLGNIGSAVAERLAAFGSVAYTGPNRKSVSWTYYPQLHDLANASDILIVTCPSNASTRHLINAGILEALGPDGYLINVARGAILDETALITALESDKLAGAALDVFEDEPNVPEALRNHPDVLLTPHIASATVETRRRMADLVLNNLDVFNNGEAPAAGRLDN